MTIVTVLVLAFEAVSTLYACRLCKSVLAWVGALLTCFAIVALRAGVPLMAGWIAEVNHGAIAGPCVWLAAVLLYYAVNRGSPMALERDQ